MSSRNEFVVGVDACPLGWFTTVIDGGNIQTETHEEFSELCEAYAEANQILVDIPIGLPEEDRRRCDEGARDLLGSRGISVFYPPCTSAVATSEYQTANDNHRDQIGHGLSQQAYNIRHHILQVANAVNGHYDGVVRESHPELCFAALNGQPVAYSKSSPRGRGLRMNLLKEHLPNVEARYRDALAEYLRKDVRRDDILDSMALAVAAQDDGLTTVPDSPSEGEPRIYYPAFEIPTLEAT